MKENELPTHLHEHFARDIMWHTRFRSFILAGVLFLMITGFGINVTLNEDLRSQFRDKELYILLGFGLLFLLAVRSFIIGMLLPATFRKIHKVPLSTRFVNSLVEITVPSLTIVVFVVNFNAYTSLVVPVVYLYFIFILLSTLDMDARLSIFSGVAGAVQYYLIASYVIDHYEAPDKLPVLGEKVFYFGKSLMMVLAGIVAGLVGEQIKRRMFNFYESKEQRDRLQKLFGQQVSEAIAHEFLESDYEIKSTRRNVCVMFLDIRDFTPMTEKMDPVEIIDYQNKVFPFMIAIIQEHHGIVNQLMGDGFMATFGAPVSAGNDCRNAVNAARAILECLREINAAGDIPETSIGIGIHFGEVVTGIIGSEIRNQYSVTGQTVIIASRIEQLNKKFHSSLLISETVYSCLNDLKDAFLSLGRIKVKGMQSHIQLFRLKT